MKEIYEPAEMEVVEFESEDVIRTSVNLPIDYFSGYSLLVNGDTLVDFDQDLIPDDEE